MIHHSKYKTHSFDYNQHNSSDGEYLKYFGTNLVPHRNKIKNKNIIKNPSIIPKNLKKYNTIPTITQSKQSVTNTSVPEDILVKAKMVQASKLFYEDGLESAQDYLVKNKINFTIDSELSNDIGLVLIDSQTGETKIAYRGTDITNSKDIITDILALVGKEKLSPEYTESIQQLEAVQEVYGKPNELIGFSRGSVLSMNLGNEYNISTTEFNPLISPSLLKNQELGSNHNIFRTKNDPVSFLAKGVTKGSKFNVKSILPLQDTLNPITEHNLSQFLTNDTPRRTTIEELLNNRIVLLGAKISEYTMMNEMLNSIENQESFSEYMAKNNPADANISESTRVYKGSNYTKLWESMGGVYSPKEMELINGNQIGISKPFETSNIERANFVGSMDRQSIINTSMDNFKNTIETSNAFASDSDKIREALVKETTITGLSPETSTALVEALNPVSQIKGLIGGLAGFEEAKLIDKLSGGALGGAGTATLGGALGAVNTSLASAALAGNLTATALLPEILSGAGGAIAGYYTQQAVISALQNAGANEDTIQSVSAITGGAVAGATTALVSIGGSIISGAEIGTALAPETAGLSIALGAGIGAVVGAGSYVVSKGISASEALIESIKNPEVNPYYVIPNYIQGDNISTLNYLQRKDLADTQRQQDESQGITPEQRSNLNLNNGLN